MAQMVYVSTRLNKYEFDLKKKYGGINQAPSDIIPVGSVLIKLLFLGFFGGFVAGAFGLGGGVVFNPILLSLGMPPRVSSATGAYLITFSKISSCLVYALTGYFIWDYAGWIALWSVIGAFIS
jgi:uncharacterized membrane protein YfcA